MMTPKAFFEFAKKNGVEMMDLKTANGYLLWPAMLDGIESDLPAPKPLDQNIYELKGEALASIPKVPGCLAESIDALEADHDFLTKGGVLSESLIDSWINWKRREEIEPMALRPHPYEFHLYYDC